MKSGTATRETAGWVNESQTKQGAAGPKTERIIKGEKRHLVVKPEGISLLPPGPIATPSHGPLVSRVAKVSSCAPQAQAAPLSWL